MIFDVSFVSPGSKAVTAPEKSSLARYPVSSFNSRSAASSGVSPLSTNPDSGRPGNQYHGNTSSLPPKHPEILPAGNSRHILPVGGRNCFTRRICLTPSFSSNAITSTAVKGQCQIQATLYHTINRPVTGCPFNVIPGPLLPFGI